LKVVFTLKELSGEDFFDDAFEFYMQNLKDNEVEEREISQTIVSMEQLEKLSLDGEDKIDNTETNGSSISFILEFNQKKLLFLADSHEDIIYENLLRLKEIGYSLEFEVTKLPHHGSVKNISSKLINLFDSKKYLISTDGKNLKNNHPNLETLAKIITKKTTHKKELIFNYEIEKIKQLQNTELEKNTIIP